MLYCNIFSLAQNNENINITCKADLYNFTNNDYSVIEFNYTNISNDTIYLWLQNWHVNYLLNDSISFKPCRALISSNINYLLFFDANKIRSFKSIFRFNERAVGDKEDNDFYIVKIDPSKTFNISITCTDSILFNLLNNATMPSVFICYSYKKKDRTDYISQNMLFNDNKIDLYVGNINSNYSFDKCKLRNVSKSFDTLKKVDYTELITTKFKTERTIVEITR